MGIQTAISHNPDVRASGKRTIPLAAKVARELRLVPTWPNLQTIRIAIESEAECFDVATEQIAEVFIRAGKECTQAQVYAFPSDWEKRNLFRLNTIDRFWFEDARWRSKFAYMEFLEKHGAIA